MTAAYFLSKHEISRTVVRCSVISGNKCRVWPGVLSIGQLVIPHITHRSADYFRRFHSANYFPHFRKLPTTVWCCVEWRASWGNLWVTLLRRRCRHRPRQDSVIWPLFILPPAALSLQRMTDFLTIELSPSSAACVAMTAVRGGTFIIYCAIHWLRYD